LLRALQALRRRGKGCHWIAGEHFVTLLQTGLDQGTREHEVHWRLLLEVLQQLGDQPRFDDTAVNFAVAFEVSPPSWENVPGASVVTHTTVPEAGLVIGPSNSRLHGEILAQRPADFTVLLNAVASSGSHTLDAGRLSRIDRASADALKEALAQAPARLAISNLSTLNAIVLEMSGIGDLADLQARKY
jgi:hypothetical protein